MTEPPVMPRKLASRQVIPTERIPADQRDKVLDDVEARIVADMARRAHEDGQQFLGWPTFDRFNFSKPFKGVELSATVLTIPR